MRYVWAAATLMHTIDGHPVRICVHACSGRCLATYPGTIRRLQRKLIAINRHYILALENVQHRELPIPPADAVMDEAQWEGLDDDLGTLLTDEPNMAVATDPLPVPVSANEPPSVEFSSATAQLLQESHDEIMRIE